MEPNPQFPADLVTFTKESFNGKLHLLCSGYCGKLHFLVYLQVQVYMVITLASLNCFHVFKNYSRRNHLVLGFCLQILLLILSKLMKFSSYEIIISSI